jgi:integrase/recombinase XerD
MTVSVYTRNKDRRYIPSSPKLNYPAGTTFVLRYTDREGKRKWETIAANNANHAVVQARLKEAELLMETTPRSTGRRTIADAIEKYMKDVRNTKAKDTAQRYAHVLNEFVEGCSKQFVDEIGIDDLKAYVGQMRQAGLSDRTIDNRLTYVGVFLHASGVSKEVKLHQRYTEKIVEAYSQEELDLFFAACDEEEWDLFQFFLCTGMRDQEVAHAEYKDINFKHGFIVVTEKDNWTTKGRKERRIPIPDHLLRMLEKRHRKYQDAKLIFPNGVGEANQHFLRSLKTVAKRANLPGEWILHKFRKSFATWHHEAGVSPRTIQAWLGHESIETTLLYLAISDVQSERTRKQVNSTFLGADRRIGVATSI